MKPSVTRLPNAPETPLQKIDPDLESTAKTD